MSAISANHTTTSPTNHLKSLPRSCICLPISAQTVVSRSAPLAIKSNPPETSCDILNMESNAPTARTTWAIKLANEAATNRMPLPWRLSISSDIFSIALMTLSNESSPSLDILTNSAVVTPIPWAIVTAKAGNCSRIICISSNCILPLPAA